MPRGRKKAAKKKQKVEEVEEEIESSSEEESSEDELPDEETVLDEDFEEDTSIEEEIIEIGEREEIGKKFKEIPAMEEEIGEILEERLYTVPLGRVYSAPRVKKRAKRAVNRIREFVVRHMKPEGILIDPLLNEIIWSRGIEKPPRKIRIRVTKDREGLVTIYHVD